MRGADDSPRITCVYVMMCAGRGWGSASQGGEEGSQEVMTAELCKEWRGLHGVKEGGREQPVQRPCPAVEGAGCVQGPQ